MTTDDVVWEEPPKRHKRSEWTDFLLKLKDRPGESARAGTYATSKEANNVASAIRNAAEALGGGWEVVSRSLAAGGGGVWARYWLGVAEDPDDALLPEAVVHVVHPDGTREGPFPHEIGRIVTPEVLDIEGNVIAVGRATMIPTSLGESPPL